MVVFVLLALLDDRELGHLGGWLVISLMGLSVRAPILRVDTHTAVGFRFWFALDVEGEGVARSRDVGARVVAILT